MTSTPFYLPPLLSLLSTITRRSDEDLPVDWRPDLEASDPHTLHLRSNTLAPHPLWMEPRFSFEARVCAQVSPLLSPPPTINPFCKITSSTLTTPFPFTQVPALHHHHTCSPKRMRVRFISAAILRTEFSAEFNSATFLAFLIYRFKFLGTWLAEAEISISARSLPCQQIPQQLGTLIDRNCEPRPWSRSRRSD